MSEMIHTSIKIHKVTMNILLISDNHYFMIHPIIKLVVNLHAKCIVKGYNTSMQARLMRSFYVITYLILISRYK